MAQLTEALATNTTVTALDLSRNSITCEGAEVWYLATARQLQQIL